MLTISTFKVIFGICKRFAALSLEQEIATEDTITDVAIVNQDFSTRQEIYLFVVLAQKVIASDELSKRVIAKAQQETGIEDDIWHVQFVNELPRNKSGKVMRRILRKILNQSKPRDFGDVSTVTKDLRQSYIDIISK